MSKKDIVKAREAFHAFYEAMGVPVEERPDFHSGLDDDYDGEALKKGSADRAADDIARMREAMKDFNPLKGFRP